MHLSQSLFPSFYSVALGALVILCFQVSSVAIGPYFSKSEGQCKVELYSYVPDHRRDDFLIYTPHGIITTDNSIVIKGVNRRLTTVFVNNTQVPVRKDGRFFFNQKLVAGVNHVFIFFGDGNSPLIMGVSRRIVKYDTSDSPDFVESPRVFFLNEPGIGISKLSPSDVVTRRHLAMFLVKAFPTYARPSRLIKPADISESDSAAETIYQVVSLGWMSVGPSGEFKPEAPATEIDYLVGMGNAWISENGAAEMGRFRDDWIAKYVQLAVKQNWIKTVDRSRLNSSIIWGDLVGRMVSITPFWGQYAQRLIALSESPPPGSIIDDAVKKIEARSDWKAGPQRVTVDQSTRLGSTRTKFVDLEGHWAKETVVALYLAGLIDYFDVSRSNEELKFEPKLYVTRGEASSLVVQFAKVPSSNLAIKISDLSENNRHYRSLIQVAALGYLQPDRRSRLFPDRPITKVEAVTLLVRLSLQGNDPSANVGAELPFNDIADVAWARPYLAEALRVGIISNASNFFPRRNVSRAEWAALIAKTPLVAARIKRAGAKE